MPFQNDTNEARALRHTMVEEQLRPRGIRDPRVLAAIQHVPRHLFGEFSTLTDAYADNASPIRCAQTISQPYMVALMSEALDVRPGHRVLEVGTGSGYQTAVLCELCPQIWSIERHPELSEQAQAILSQLGYAQAQLLIGDGSRGLPEEAPFDCILVAAAAKRYPTLLLEQLSPHQGILVFPLEHSDGKQSLLKIVRKDAKTYNTYHLGGVRFVPLVEES